MNGKLGLSGVSIIFVIAVLSACGGGSSSSGTSSPGSTSTPPGNTGTAPPPGDPGGSQRPASIAGFVYAVNRTSGTVSGYTINSTTGALSEVAGSPFAAGSDPISLTVDPAGRFVYVSNHVSNTLRAYVIDDDTGILSEVAGSPYPLSPAPWSVDIDPAGNFAYVVSGGAGPQEASQPRKISVFSIRKSTGGLSEIAGSPFAGWTFPGRFVFSRSGSIAYVISASSTGGAVHTLAVDTTTGAFSEVGSVETGISPSGLSITPSGKYAYVANHEDVMSYSIDPANGALSRIDPDVRVPTHQANLSSLIDPSGKFVYVASSYGNVSAFRIDPASGRLSEIPGSPFAAGDSLGFFILHPAGGFAYAANHGVFPGPGYVSAFAIDASTGALSEIGGSPFSDGGNPNRLAIDPTGRVAYAVNCDPNDACAISGYTINTTSGALGSVGSVSAGQYTIAIEITGVL